MAKNRKADVVLGTVASIATILGLVLSIYSTFLPNQLNEVTGRFLGPVDAGGRIRAEFVSSQKWLFISTWALVSLSIGVGIAGFWNYISALNARAIAAGRETRVWYYWLFLVFALLCVSLGIGLPKAIFLPTNTAELARQFVLGSWALRSPLGGIVLGLFIFATAFMVAFFIHWVGMLLRSLRGKQYQRIMENS